MTDPQEEKTQLSFSKQDLTQQLNRQFVDIISATLLGVFILFVVFLLVLLAEAGQRNTVLTPLGYIIPFLATCIPLSGWIILFLLPLRKAHKEIIIKVVAGEDLPKKEDSDFVTKVALYQYNSYLKNFAEETAREQAEKAAREAEAEARALVEYEITLPQSTKWQPFTASGFTKALFDQTDDEEALALAIEATHNQITWLVAVEGNSKTLTHKTLTNLVAQFYPGSEVNQRPEREGNFPYHLRYTIFTMQAAQYFDHFAPVNTQTRNDPLIMVAQTIANLQPGEKITYWLVALAVVTPSAKHIQDFLTQDAYSAGVRYRSTRYYREGFGEQVTGDIIRWWKNQGLKNERIDRFDEKTTRYYLQKLGQKLAYVTFFATVITPDKTRCELLTAVASSIRSLSFEGNAHLNNGADNTIFVKGIDDVLQRGPIAWLDNNTDPDEPQRDIYEIPLTADELAAFWHLPHSGFEDLPVNWAVSIPQQVIATGDKDEIVIGTSTDSKTTIAITRPDRRYHAYITGQPGMGKSTLLHNLIQQDIQAGEGVAVLDPHGTLIKAILDQSIADNRVDDLVLLDCADTAYPVSLNPFRTPKSDDPEATFQQILWTIKAIYADSWSETQMQTVYSTILQTILTDPEATPLDIQEVIDNPNYRRRIVSRAIKEDRLSQRRRNFWRNFENQSHSRQQDRVTSTFNRMEMFLGSTHLENMTCHPRGLDFKQLIRDRKIILINLHGNNIATQAGGLGAIFLSQLHLASKDLGAIEGDQPPRFYVYIDEAHQVISNAPSDLFAESRKFGLSLTLANQYIGQLDTTTREAISGTVGTKISFNCSHEEAAATAKLYKPDIDSDQLITLSVGQAAIRTRIKGHVPAAFLCQTSPPITGSDRQDQLSPDELKKRSRENLGLITSEKVRDWIKSRYDSDQFKTPPSEPDLVDFE
jgi:hypothetical protein